MKRLVMFGLLIFLVSCASTATVKNIVPSIQLTDKIQTLTVRVDKGPSTAEQAMEFREAIVSELKENGITVVEASDNILLVVIKDIRVVSLMRRMAFGDFAGKSQLKADVTFQDDGKIFRSFSVSGKSGGLTNPIYNPGSIGQVFRATAREIVVQLKK